MSFQGDAPYGVSRSQDTTGIDTTNADWRIAIGSAVIAYLLTNGEITVRNRDAVESVIRTLGAQGQAIVSIVVLDDNATIDSNVTQMNFAAGIAVQEVSPGVINILIPSAAIVTAMLANAAVTPAQLDRGYRSNGLIQAGFVSIGSRVLSGSVSAQSLYNVPNLVNGVTYDGFIAMDWRVYATGGVPSDGAFTMTAGGYTTTGNAVQSDSGVDSTVHMFQTVSFTQSSGSPFSLQWGWNWTDGTLQVTGASMMEWFLVPR